MEVLGIWCLIAVVAGLAVGAAIRKNERVQKEEFLSCLFSTLETLQANR
jgi:hypothetical protein